MTALNLMLTILPMLGTMCSIYALKFIGEPRFAFVSQKETLLILGEVNICNLKHRKHRGAS